MKTTEQILLDYKTAKIALDIMQRKVDEKKALVVEALKGLPEHKAKIDDTSFSLRAWTTYEYTKEVTNMQNKLRALQKLEVTTGRATIKSETYAPVMRVANGPKGGEQEDAE